MEAEKREKERQKAIAADKVVLFLAMTLSIVLIA